MSKKLRVHIVRTAQARVDGPMVQTMCGIVAHRSMCLTAATFKQHADRERCATCEKIATTTGSL